MTVSEHKDFIAGIFSRASETYDNVDAPYFTHIGRRLVEVAGIRPGMRVLDVGTGRGAALFPAAEAVGPTGHVTGIDLAADMIRRTTADARARGMRNVDVRVGDAEDPDLADGSLDAILASLVIFFLPDPAHALRRYAELLRPAGTVALTVFGQSDDTRWKPVGEILKRYTPGDPHDNEPPAVARPAGLRAALEAAGFADIAVELHREATTFRDKEQWWSWAWSHGQRIMLEQVPAADLDSVRAECFKAIDVFAAPDGTVPMWNEVGFVTAVRP